LILFVACVRGTFIFAYVRMYLCVCVCACVWIKDTHDHGACAQKLLLLRSCIGNSQVTFLLLVLVDGRLIHLQRTFVTVQSGRIFPYPCTLLMQSFMILLQSTLDHRPCQDSRKSQGVLDGGRLSTLAPRRTLCCCGEYSGTLPVCVLLCVHIRACVRVCVCEFVCVCVWQ